MTWEQTAEVLAKEVDRLQKENDEKSFVNDMFSKIILESCEANTRNQETLKNMARKWRKEAGRLEAGIQEAISESYKDIGEGKTISQIFEDLEALVSPAAEGGGAANGGESQALQDRLVEENQIIREAILDSDRVHHKIEKKLNKAIQSAIMGLHTLAGDFPTPTWKTREDYLQATISEINEILGKQ